MAFFQRIISYVANEVIVNGLANRHAHKGRRVPQPSLTPPLSRSTTFQKFAIRTDAKMRAAHVTGKDTAKTAVSQAMDFAKAFREELLGKSGGGAGGAGGAGGKLS